MTEQQRSLSQVEIPNQASVDRVFNGGQFFYLPHLFKRDEDGQLTSYYSEQAKAGVVYVKARMIAAIDPLRGDTWKATDSRSLRLLNGQLVEYHFLNIVKGDDVDFGARIDIAEQKIKLHDADFNQLGENREITHEIMRGWAMLSVFGKAIPLDEHGLTVEGPELSDGEA
jgi:hypothetical protein